MSVINSAVGTLNSEQVQQVLATAQRAPSVHRLRPWRFECTETTIELLLDMPGDEWDAGGSSADEDHREATVACGAALLNLRLAVRSLGIEPVVHLMPQVDRPALLAAVEIDGRRATTSDGQELSSAIGRLDTHTRRFETTSVPEALAVDLRYAARIEQAWIALLPAAALPSLREAAAGSGAQRLLDPSAHVAVVGTLQDDSGSRLRAGQAMQRILLTVTKSGLSASFIAMSPALRTSRAQLRQVLGGGLWPQVVLHIGRTTA